MAERDTWESIRTRGLLSTSAVLDHFGLTGADRVQYESQQRPIKMEVILNHPASIVLRDQKPMPRSRLITALQDGITPEDWYRIINAKVFFWATRTRLLSLLNARDYRLLEHDVLTIDAAPFIRAYADQIWLCHMNSGNTWPWPHPRGANTFRRISDYPTGRSGRPLKEVAELVVDHSVPDIAQYVIEVNRMRGAEVLRRIL
ncbi:DUF7002 family protein [Burkholderia thailandensis]|nr:hypothetical protein [Burkholderia thailandensis]MBS2130047.1 hypothetical protein [Burkholderia thailandensis]MCS6520582.1 hypothetical protein [Burkholderia thailandensis]QRA14873.1 hypothetical protein JMY07_23080 [Burkholderia thailandensis]